MKKISIIGGDLRLFKLYQLLKNDGYDVNIFYFEKLDLYKKDEKLDFTNLGDIIIGPIPFSKDNIYLNTPFSNNKININILLKKIENKILITGAIKNEIEETARKNNIKVIDVMKNEELAILNSIPTIEGAIKIIIENTINTIHGSNILILGFGRIGKLLADRLKSFGANVSCEARKLSDLAWIKAYSYNPVNISNLEENLASNKYNIIINTVPYILLDKNKLKKVDKDTLIVDLASKPGGIDIIEAKNQNLKVIVALSLPGKIAPETSAIYIKKTIENLLK